MITIGVDAHKRVHAAVAVDDGGREIGQWRGPNSVDGWHQLARWAAQLGAPCRWGIEGGRNYGRGPAQDLVASGAEVYEISPRWTAAGRWRARRTDKNDCRDAQAIALLVWREAGDLPRVIVDDETAVLDLLVTEREDSSPGSRACATSCTRCCSSSTRSTPCGCRACGHRPGCAPWRPTQSPTPARSSKSAPPPSRGWPSACGSSPIRPRRSPPRSAPLVTIRGIDLLTAGALAGILGPGRRFASDAQLAAYAGVAPREASSAGRVRHRLDRGGNRRLNAIL